MPPRALASIRAALKRLSFSGIYLHLPEYVTKVNEVGRKCAYLCGHDIPMKPMIVEKCRRQFSSAAPAWNECSYVNNGSTSKRAPLLLNFEGSVFFTPCRPCYGNRVLYSSSRQPSTLNLNFMYVS